MFDLLKDAYESRGLESVLVGLNGREGNQSHRLSGYRHDVRCPLRVIVQNEMGQNVRGYDVIVSDASLGGMRVCVSLQDGAPSPLQLFVPVSATVKLAHGVFSNLRILPIWRNRLGQFGVQICKSEPTWRNFIAEIEESNEVPGKRRAA